MEGMKMAESIPYIQAYGNLTKALERIRDAQTPPRFTQDFLETKLNLKGGSARPVIPFLKRTGFLAPDGAPTELYRRFRGTPDQSGAAVAEALKIGYAPLYAVNEYVHDAKDPDINRERRPPGAPALRCAGHLPGLARTRDGAVHGVPERFFEAER
jgi:hypothetical protein